MDSKEKISDSLKKLETIARWFDAQKEIDVEEGLKKVKEGAELIKELRQKLKKTENEFNEIKKELDEVDEDNEIH
ncbi:MAG: Uncharacterized protein G01um101433_585 [Parcubacteria group bacterium Gr01-1014_33]|nr:MAG: Uncharacterized protein G01um101433_585 [Parcubacteria group bacterium Gr01-1014_33]